MIHITQDGFKLFEWDGEIGREVEREFESIHYLREGVTEVEAGVTLAQIIHFTYRDEFLRGFIGCYSGCNVGAFYEELGRGVKAFDPDGEMQFCTVAMEVEVSESKKYQIAKTLDVSLDFHGCGKGGKTWALDLAPLKEIAALPFRLEANAHVQHLMEGACEVEDGLQYTPSLLEVLDAIFYDISFHGPPEERDARRRELEKAHQEIMDGTATLTPLKLDEDM